MAALVSSALAARAARPDAGVTATATSTDARDAGPAPRDAAADAAPPQLPAAVAALRWTTRQLQALVDERLAVAIDPATLFEVPFEDEAAIRVETERLRAIVEAAAAPSDASVGQALRPLDPMLYAARIELDRARLGFYSLGREQGEALLARHAQRQGADTSSQAAVEVNEANRRAQSAETERQRALDAARRARSEAERMVAEERARLLGVAGAQAQLEGKQVGERQALKARAEQTLGFVRRVRDAIAADPGDTAAAADALYLGLRTWLRATRDALAEALSASAREIPAPGEDRLAGLSVDVDRRDNDRARAELVKAAAALRATEEALRWDRMTQLEAETLALNTARLQLLAKLSRARRTAIVGFGEAGWDQAVAEVRQVVLVIGYHLKVFTRWLSALRGGAGGARGKSAMVATFVALKWLLVLVAFLWWRPRAQAVLEQWRDRAREEDRRARRTSPGLRQRAIGHLLHVRGPLELLLLGLALLWLLPAQAKGLFEVEILFVVVAWTLGGALAVMSIDAAASGVEEVVGGRGSASAQLRLRSLRLTGRTVVVVGLILAISARIVGKGTIYSWVLSTLWFIALPVFLVLIRWWRHEIFRRMARFRRRRAYFRWVVDHQTGWRSFPAATSGGVYLFFHGAAHASRTWLSSFDVTRRLLAYLFRRGLDKLADGARFSLLPVPEALFAKFSPTAPPAEILSDEEDGVAPVIKRICAEGGGVYVVVGERGGGKSTVLRRVRDSLAAVSLVDCPIAGLDALRLQLARTLGLDERASLEEAGRAANASSAPGGDPALLIDNAHRLIQPRMGGLAAFDQLLDAARHHSSSCSWVFAIDHTLWRFFERARGARPAFDEVITLAPWSESRVVALLRTRSHEAGIEPRFDHLVERLPTDADELELEEAHARTEARYHRLIWDYAAGNPGVALHMWRRSLGLDPQGRVFVKLFRAPDPTDLEALPDRAVFVLRAVVQLELATTADIRQATMLPEAQVENAIRYGLARGYFEEVEGRYRVTWGWFRAATRVLQRRHLLPVAR
ncbi:MAG: AAA family ATPase [Proteobacteria bacterium]|nr:AAA family ATPase [Pseudomonadota bacterium]